MYLRSIIPKRKQQQVLPDSSLSLLDIKMSRRKIKTYAKLCGFKHENTVPLSYPHILAFPLMLELMLDRAFPFPVVGMVHVSNSFTQHRKIHWDEKLDINCCFGELKDHRKGKLVELLCEVSIAGECVWQSRSDMLVRQKVSQQVAPEKPRDPLTEYSATWTLPAGLGRQYALMSGDSNPIHISDLSAKAFGFKQCIIHGMWTNARCLAQLQDQLPDACIVAVDFKNPVYLPSTLDYFQESTANGWLFDVRSEGGRKSHLIGSITSVQNNKVEEQ